MSASLTVDKNIQNLCRICFEIGNINIWQYKVKLKHNIETANRSEIEPNEEATVHGILQTFNKCERSVLDLCNDMPLICHICLESLLQCYYFYQKLLKANEHVKQLFDQASKNEIEKNVEIISCELINIEYCGNSTQVINESNVVESMSGNVDNFCNIVQMNENTSLDAVKHHEGEVMAQVTEGLESQITAEVANQAQSASQPPVTKNEHTLTTNTATQPPLKRNLKRPLIILTGGVSQMLTHLNEEIETNVAVIEQPKKRFRSDELMLEPKTDAVPTPLKTDATSSNLIKNNNLSIPTNETRPSTALNSFEVYACKHCNNAFSAPEFLQSHVTQTHVCKFCTEIFRKGADLHEHMRQMHQKSFCNICKKEFYTRRSMIMHMKRLHNMTIERPFNLEDHMTSVI